MNPSTFEIPLTSTCRLVSFAGPGPLEDPDYDDNNVLPFASSSSCHHGRGKTSSSGRCGRFRFLYLLVSTTNGSIVIHSAFPRASMPKVRCKGHSGNSEGISCATPSTPPRQPAVASAVTCHVPPIGKIFLRISVPTSRCCCGYGCGFAPASEASGLGVLLGLAHVQAYQGLPPIDAAVGASQHLSFALPKQSL